MKCEADYCIYNRDFLCVLDEIQLNALGMCDECMLVSISDEDLRMLKEKQLEDIINRN